MAHRREQGGAVAASVWREQVKSQTDVSVQLLTTEAGLTSPQQANRLEIQALLERKDVLNVLNSHQESKNQALAG